MLARLRHLLELVRSTLWLVPGLMSIGAAILAFTLLWVDGLLPPGAGPPEAISFRAGDDAARALLTTLAGAMITVTGVTFSITIVAMSLASQQFGPRLLRNFLRDRVNHVVLGTFLGTFLYALLVLQAIEESDTASLPRISVSVAVLLGIASLAVLIYFIHHIAHSIQADNVIASVSRELEGNIDRMYPEPIGEEPEDDAPREDVPEDMERDAVVVRASASGYFQTVDDDDLLALAKREALVLRLVHRPGDFIIDGSPLLLAWPRERLPKGFEDEVRKLLLLGPHRTAEQDIEFSIDQLVEIAVRALSPGINDPFSAIRCVDRLGSALCRLCSRGFPSPYRTDEQGALRIIAQRPDFEGLVNAAFDQIREHAQREVAVTIHLLEVLETVGSCAGRSERLLNPLRAQAERVWHGAKEAGHIPSDLESIERRYRDAMAALATGTGAGGIAMQPRKRG